MDMFTSSRSSSIFLSFSNLFNNNFLSSSSPLSTV